MSSTRALKLLAGASILTGVTFGCVAAADASKPDPAKPDEHKVTICHTSKGNNPHEIEVDYKGALGHAKTDPLDIIPAFPGFEGQNLDKENPCQPLPTTTTLPTTTVTLAPTTSTTVVSTVTTVGPTTTLVTSTTTVPVTTVTTLPTTTIPEETTTWTTPSSTVAPTTTLPSTTITTMPRTSQTTTKVPVTSVAPTTVITMTTVTEMSPTFLTPQISAGGSSLPVTGNNPWLRALAGVVLVLFGMTLLKRSKK